MKPEDILALQNEPACAHNKKSKSGCARPQPGATQGGCCFDGARNALLPIADCAHIVHGPIGCAGSLVGQSRHPLVGGGFVPGRHDHRSQRDGRHHGPGRKAPLSRHPPGRREQEARRRLRLCHLRSRPAWRRHRDGLQNRRREIRRPGNPGGWRRLLWQQEPWQPGRRRRGVQICHRPTRARPGARLGPTPRHHPSRCQSDRRMECGRRVLERRSAVRRTGPAHPLHPFGRFPFPRSPDHASGPGQYGGLFQGHAVGGAAPERGLRHPLLRGQLLWGEGYLPGLPRLRPTAGGPRPHRPHRGPGPTRRSPGRGSPGAPAPPADRQAGPGLHRRVQKLVHRLGHAGPGHGGGRHRHREIHRGRQGPHP